MLNRREILAIVSVSVIIAFSITLLLSFTSFLIALLSIFIIITINTFVKKFAGHYFETEIEVKLWEFKRWGYKPRDRFKKNFPAGAFFPIISKILFFPFGGFVWMASLIFDVKAKVYRAAKRHGFYSFSEVTEDHIGYIAALGIFVNLLLAFLAYLIGFSEFAKFSIWFAFFNMIPLSNLDGNKIFFGSRVIWSILAAVTIIALIYTFFGI